MSKQDEQGSKSEAKNRKKRKDDKGRSPWYGNAAFRTAAEDAQYSKLTGAFDAQQAGAYSLAYTDEKFLLRDELRPVRLQLELLKPELAMQENGIDATAVVFGSARIPSPEEAEHAVANARAALEVAPNDKALARKLLVAENHLHLSKYYREARELARLISINTGGESIPKLHIVTGGGPGIMEAANRGASEAGSKSLGLNIVLPREQQPNPWVDPELCFQFHYFALRKMHFLMRAKVLIAFPGGYGTLDELMETLTLLQTNKINPLPVLVFGREFWESVINFKTLSDFGMIDEEDLGLFSYVETAEEAWDIIEHYCLTQC